MGIARRLLTVLIGALVVTGALGAPALAHNALTGSDPTDGATVDTDVEQVRLTFLSSLDPGNADLDVTGPDGASVRDGEPTFDGREVTIPVRPEVAGDYRIEFGVLSTDGHWVEGTVEFTLTAEAVPQPSPQPTAVPTDSPTAPAADPATTDPAATDPAISSPAPTAAESSGTAAIWTVVALLVVAGLVGLFIAHQLRRRRSRGAADPSI